ncbi:MAG: type III-B CRISPR module RAMP protein Cmr1 [Chitinophagales bacterium]|nr:type III-B CRISPR module RAMP protein Cmr1 [Chitinophagales bacterium]
MNSITFTCETITPMFLNGADGITPELRAPSIKGALRFWWRALHGHESNMKELETKIFGGLGNNTAMRSSFSIQMITPLKDSDIYDLTWKQIGCEEKVSKKGKPYIDSRNAKLKGLAYLYYSTWLDGENIRKSIKPNVVFEFKIIFHKMEYFDHIINALKALVFLGALGTRSRRGSGSFWIKDLNFNEYTDEELRKKEQELKKIFHNKGITSVEGLQEYVEDNFSITSHGRNDYSHLKKAKIYFAQSTTTNWAISLETIAKPFFEFRTTVKGRITDTPNFGFPILHQNLKTTMQGGKWTVVNGKKEIDKLERRSSPLIFKLIKVNEEKVFPIVVWLSGDLIPQGYEIMDKTGHNQKLANPEIVKEFLDQKFPNLTSIIL